MDMKKLMDVRGAGSIFCLMAMGSVAGGAGAQRLELERGKASVVVEAYAPNIVRVTMSLDKARAMMGPGYGILAKPDAAGWTAETNEHGDVLKSARMGGERAGAGEAVHGKAAGYGEVF
jgi:alpha-D-xyloside xylohydrolase